MAVFSVSRDPRTLQCPGDLGQDFIALSFSLIAGSRGSSFSCDRFSREIGMVLGLQEACNSQGITFLILPGLKFKEQSTWGSNSSRMLLPRGTPRGKARQCPQSPLPRATQSLHSCSPE